MNHEKYFKYYKEDMEKPCCYFHPKEVTIGVCALCLNDRLLVLASRQYHTRKPSFTLPNILSLGSSLRNLLDFNHKQFIDDDDHGHAFPHTHDNLDSPSPEDSFISIKFEGNGAVSWEKDKVSKFSSTTMNHHHNKDTTKSVVEVKPRGSGSLRWRKRIGHMFQVSRWRRSSKASVCHVGAKLEGGKKVRNGWIRTLTKRRNTE